MAIKIESKMVAGFRFSDICFKKDTKDIERECYEFITELLEGEIAKKFEDSTINPEEVSPEFIALVFDLDYFDYEWSDKEDAIIGIELAHTDIGQRNVGLTSFNDVEVAVRKITARIESIDPSMLKKVKIEVGVVSNMKEVEV
jgi:hypothetical protein